MDLVQKLVDYFKLPTIHHYLIIFADRSRVIHHRRHDDGIETRIMTQGDITLITITLDELYTG